MLLVRNNKSIKSVSGSKGGSDSNVSIHNTCLPDNLITSLDQIELRKQESLSGINPSKIIPQIQPRAARPL